MQNGILKRKSVIKINTNTVLEITSERFYHILDKDQAYLRYEVKNLGKKVKIELISYLDFDIWNQDTNYDEPFWDFEDQKSSTNIYWVQSSTKKTRFTVLAAQKNIVQSNGKKIKAKKIKRKEASVGQRFEAKLKEQQSLSLTKHTCITSTFYYDKRKLEKTTINQITNSKEEGYETIKRKHCEAWNEKWKLMDVNIVGDVSAQQGIRYNIFQLHQTYTGDDSRLNIGPKGFTGEKYGGSTYWDTEAYCLPFYLSTADENVAKSLYASILGFSSGAALYPMVTMNGEECHNEWEITFEEIHRNGAIAYAIYDYVRYTGDKDYILNYGIDVLVGIARFWAQRVNWSEDKSAYVILGVTGPNEYENNVNNNWYTNYIAKWCLEYTVECYHLIKEKKPLIVSEINKRLMLTKRESDKWLEIADKMFLPSSRKHGIFLQQDGFLDKEQVLTKDLDVNDRPINQKWSWDRIVRSPYIKQADVLQGLYFFEEKFSKRTIEKNFDYYEPRTVHESSLSPCVHSILAASLDKEDKAYEMYLRTSRLDLDNYNNDTEDGLHITSMAGSWLSVIKGFAGMRVEGESLSFKPFLPKSWKSYAFNILHRGKLVRLKVQEHSIEVKNLSSNKVSMKIYKKRYSILPSEVLHVQSPIA
jgi:maltose phosphorylase